MDPQRFDRLAMTLSATGTRRGALAALLSGSLSLRALLQQAQGRTRRGGGGVTIQGPCRDGSGPDNACERDRDCCTGICARTRRGRRRCRCRRQGQACTQSRNCCQGAGQNLVCDGGTCQETCAYGASACETPTTVCGPNIVTCGADPNCWAMPTTGGCCACSSAPGQSHETCGSNADCVNAAECDFPAGRCHGDRGLSCTTDNDCASLATCRDGACGGPICTTDDDCEAAFRPGTVCISGAELPCTASGANICWTLCTGA